MTSELYFVIQGCMLKIKMHFFLILLLLFSKINAAALRDSEESALPRLSYSTQTLLIRGALGFGAAVNPLSVKAKTTPILYSLIVRPLNLENVCSLEGLLEKSTAEELQAEFKEANPVIRLDRDKSQKILDDLRKDLAAIHRFLISVSALDAS